MAGDMNCMGRKRVFDSEWMRYDLLVQSTSEFTNATLDAEGITEKIVNTQYCVPATNNQVEKYILSTKTLLRQDLLANPRRPSRKSISTSAGPGCFPIRHATKPLNIQISHDIYPIDLIN